MKARFVLAIFALGVFGACSTTAAERARPEAASEEAGAGLDEAQVMEEGRSLTRQLYAGETASIWSRMTEQMQEALGSEEDLRVFLQHVEQQLGTETEVVDERSGAVPPYQVYLRTALFSKHEGPVHVQWTFDPEGRIAGFFIRPAQ